MAVYNEMMKTFQRWIFVTGVFLGWPLISLASGLVMNDSELRNDLVWLSARGVIHLNLSTWPLSQAEAFLFF